MCLLSDQNSIYRNFEGVKACYLVLDVILDEVSSVETRKEFFENLGME